jgi:hypothetical protein
MSLLSTRHSSRVIVYAPAFCSCRLEAMCFCSCVLVLALTSKFRDYQHQKERPNKAGKRVETARKQPRIHTCGWRDRCWRRTGRLRGRSKDIVNSRGQRCEGGQSGSVPILQSSVPNPAPQVFQRLLGGLRLDGRHNISRGVGDADHLPGSLRRAVGGT